MKKILFFIGITFFSLFIPQVLWAETDYYNVDYNMEDLEDLIEYYNIENLEEFLKPSNVSEEELQRRKELFERDPELAYIYLVDDIANNRYTPKQMAVLGVIHRDRNKAIMDQRNAERAAERAAAQGDPIYEKYGKYTGFLPSEGAYQDAVESLKEEEFKEKVLPLVLGLGLFLVVVVMIKIFIRKIDFKEEN
ncbi:MAG: hypothetical protein J6V30_00285 [Paludibacteraceae bacterium]|nr:hypothetical protein [Paludibacteraceae bacterium]